MPLAANAGLRTGKKFGPLDGEANDIAAGIKDQDYIRCNLLGISTEARAQGYIRGPVAEKYSKIMIYHA